MYREITKPETRLIDARLVVSARRETSFDGHRADHDWIKVSDFPDTKEGLRSARELCAAPQHRWERMQILRIVTKETNLPLVARKK